MKRKTKRLKLMLVLWGDATSMGGSWHKARELPTKAARCLQVGFLAKETKEVMDLAGGISEDGEFSEVGVVPKGMVIAQKLVVELPTAFSTALNTLNR